MVDLINSKLIEFNGKIASISEHCMDLGIDRRTVYKYKQKHNLSYEEVLTHYQEVGTRKNKKRVIEIDGQLVPILDYCEKLGYNYKSIEGYRDRYKISWEEALDRYLKNKNRRKVKDRRLWRIWYRMIDRCYNSKNNAYEWYGERGITVQDSWKDDYFNFEDDMLESYTKHVEEHGEKDTTLDRIDYNGNYELNNLRWATQEEQANNKRNNTILVDNLTIAEFCRKYNLDYSIVCHRLMIGWTVDDLLNPAHRVEYINRYRKVKHKLPCGISLKYHCIQNKYKYVTILGYIKKYNLLPDEALARYLKNRKKRNK